MKKSKRCFYCEREFNKHVVQTIDHIIPISKGGNNKPVNKVPACARWPNCRFFTYVNPKMVQSTNPGYCFKICGWVNVGKSSKGLHILEKANNHLHIGKNC